MKFVDEFRDPALGRRVLARIAAQVEALGATAQAPVRIMEVCGGHTHAIFRYGLNGVLPEALMLVHGPGCPVCVLPMGRVDDAVALARQPGVILASFGDALRVPGSGPSLMQARAAGADVRTVYAPADALALAREHPERPVVFFALGFETTAPATALTLLQAEAEGVENLFVFSNHITIVPTLRALLENPELRLHGFVGPGHVSAVIGTRPYAFVAERYGVPLVVSGFEPLDLLQSIAMVLQQRIDGVARVENQYIRVVGEGGNPQALAAMAAVFEARPSFEWRGLGLIPSSGLQLTARFARFDAERRFAVPGQRAADPRACQCGRVLIGAIQPRDCKVFGTACTPETPIGACMVSAEGACAAEYRYGGPR
ncbi:MAG: hydrogenase formation protein HypD [Alphaproteobacteria bacterium]|nr:hydrogenase formation protein HypD [Alphaproteobacteria bacterium]